MKITVTTCVNTTELEVPDEKCYALWGPGPDAKQDRVLELVDSYIVLCLKDYDRRGR